MPRDALHPLPQPVFAEPVFNEATLTQDPFGFHTQHPSDTEQYAALGDALQKDVVGFDESRGANHDLYSLSDALGPHGTEIVQKVTQNQQIVFHAIGDSGASNVRKYSNELRVADQLTLDAQTAQERDRPIFLFHLGDVVYDFGEAEYYYDQFYEPFRNYPGPIFAIPGNHDSFVIPGTAVADMPLKTFRRNFCAESTVITPEARSLHRTAMTQPGVYFTLNAPFVRIIGLFSNALEDPGVISSQGGQWVNVPDVQLDFLEAQLIRIKEENYKGAVLVAVHHPPFSYAMRSAGPSGLGGNHGSSSDMLRQIDTICSSVGVYPHAFLNAHAHNYQRYTRKIKFSGKDIQVPFIVCGDGGHNANPLVRSRRGQPAQDPNFGDDVSYLESNPAVETLSLTLEKYDDQNYGYLRVIVDDKQLRIGFHQTSAGSLRQSRFDLVTVDLLSHTIVANTV